MATQTTVPEPAYEFQLLTVTELGGVIISHEVQVCEAQEMLIGTDFLQNHSLLLTLRKEQSQEMG
jgi:hypothetical protein